MTPVTWPIVALISAGFFCAGWVLAEWLRK
jgi:hypothetical protein